MDEKWGRFVWHMEHGKGLIHLDGYYPRTLEEIYDNERAGVENLNNISYVSVLAYCKPCQKAYRILLEESPLVCHTYRSIFMAMIQPVLKESLTSFCHRAN